MEEDYKISQKPRLAAASRPEEMGKGSLYRRRKVLQMSALIEGTVLHLGAGRLIGLSREGVTTLASLSPVLQLFLVLPVG